MSLSPCLVYLNWDEKLITRHNLACHFSLFFKLYSQIIAFYSLKCMFNNISISQILFPIYYFESQIPCLPLEYKMKLSKYLNCLNYYGTKAEGMFGIEWFPHRFSKNLPSCTGFSFLPYSLSRFCTKHLLCTENS
jgi:hypothetical protein